MQKKLLKIIDTPEYKSLHNPKYSVVANPFRHEFQNCTGFILYVLMSTLYNTTDINQIIANAQAYFTPQEIKLSGLKKFMGNLFVKDFSTSDHPSSEILTTTDNSLPAFMQKYNLVDKIIELKE